MIVSSIGLLLILSHLVVEIHGDNQEFHLYMDNQTLCNHQGIIKLHGIQTGKIYSHWDYHNEFFYFPDHHCSITIKTDRRTWISIDSFQLNSTVPFPRCTEAKYAGNDDRLQIIDREASSVQGEKNGAILRILCGKDTDERFDRSPLILKNSLFTFDWRTKSRALGFVVRFVTYDLAIDGSCPNANQFLCRNNRCINSNLICSDEDLCGDRSHLDSSERIRLCPSKILKEKFQDQFRRRFFLIFTIGFSFCFLTVAIIKLIRFCFYRTKIHQNDL